MALLSPFLLLAGLNAWIVAKWAGLEYTNRLDSIEWVYIALARHYREWGWQTLRGAAEWFPWWYNGVPIENTYPPFLPWMTAFCGAWLEVSNGRAYHLTTAFFFVLGPLALYSLAWRWTASRWAALLAAGFYSCLSASAMALPSVAGDLNSLWLNQRVNVLARYGEGPHVASLSMLPLVLWAFERCVSNGSRRRWAGAALLVAATMLTNLIGAMTVAWAALAGVAAWGGRAAWVNAGICLWGWAIAFRFAHPWFLEDIRRNAPRVGGSFPMGWPQYLGCAALAVLVLFVGWILRRRAWSPAAIAAVGFAIPLTAIPLTWEFAQFHVIPQPHRYHLEMELAWALLLAFVLAPLRRWLALPVAGIAIFALAQGRGFDPWIEGVDVKTAFPWRANEAMRRIDPDARVYMIGGPRYLSGLERWQAQAGGGFANGTRLRGFAVGDYGIFAGRGNFEDTRDWLLTYGVDYVLVGGGETADWIRDWRDGAKFAGRLRQVWEEGDDRWYALDRANQSLAHAVPRSALVTATPAAFYGQSEIQRYARAAEQGAIWEWRGPSCARIRAVLKPGEVVSTQVAWDWRWRGKAGGHDVEPKADGLGMMYFEVPRSGAVELDLVFRNPRWILALSCLALAAALFCLLPFRRWRE
jgi:hypothetical protein